MSGTGPRYRAYIKSDAWRTLRGLVFKRDGYRCRYHYCGSTRRLQAHHVHYRSLFRETGTELVTLCRVCHEFEHRFPLSESEDEWDGQLDPVRSTPRKAWKPDWLPPKIPPARSAPKPFRRDPNELSAPVREWLDKRKAERAARITD